MASNKMLIDASHPEETRVVVLRGNRIEEFDFESQNKRQLKGNIYLAKVTRVEPSLQAAFVDYGGNRHGFLAFNEIHPDYYQIPVADRQALLEEDAAEARRERAREDNESIESEEQPNTKDTGEDDIGDTEEPVETKPKRRQRRPRKKTTSRKSDAASDEKNDSVSSGDSEEEASANSADDNPQDSDDNPKSIAAIIETDSISEPAPDEEPSSDEEATGEDEGEPAAAPKKRARSTRRPRKTKASEEVVEEEVIASTKEQTSSQEAEQTDSDAVDTTAKEEDTQPKTRRKKRSSRSRKSSERSTKADDENGDDSVEIESVGSQDALEEVPQRRRPRRQYKIQEVVKRRQVMLVQVVKEERGNKGAALTTYLSLAGRYSVLMPNTARGGGISRKITNADDRRRLKAIASELDVPEGMGVILRTAGASRTKAEIQRDFEYLMRLWENVRSLTLSSSAPCLVYQEGSLIKRSIRDLYDKNTGEVLVAGENGYKEAHDFMQMLMPSHAKNVKLFSDEQAMFARFGIEQQLDKMLSQQVTLKSGGYLVIDQTEALVAIDVNSGRATREHSIEDTALQTNLETAEEVARQLRLRDLAGLIVIDFIDMEEKRNNRAVEKKLKDCLKNDRARIQVGRISHFGLMEMSRQRMRASVLDSTMDICPHCQGKGHMRSNSSVSLHILRAIDEHLLKNSRFDLVVKTANDVALYILNHKRPALMEIEKRFGLKIFIEGSHDLLGENFTLEKGEASTGEPKPVTHIQAGQISNDAPEQSDPEDISNTQEDAENTGKRKRRRRRGRKGVEETSDVGTEQNSADTTPQSGVEENASNDDEADTDNGKRKRTRGKRGGRKTRSSAENTENNDSPKAASQKDEGVVET
ncbi:MAG: Rne/Rng family ribonuclease, partial [Rhizobiaceae bacterium]|nr:Rne/Rng family ribonuclease [Rhizobiaceae bacterium]